MGQLVHNCFLERHEKSTSHLNGVNFVAKLNGAKAVIPKKQVEGEIAFKAVTDKLKMVNHMIKNHEGVTTMFKKFHDLLTEELKYEPLLAHRKALHSSRGDYLSNYSVWEMASAMKKYLKEEAVKQLKSKKCF